jgi:hypothetical protein
VTLYELGAVLATLLCAGLGALVGSVVGGPAGGLIGWGVGAAFLPGIGVVAICLESHFTGRPHWPACRSCGGQRFEYVWTLGQDFAHCECGQRYVRRERRCLRVTPGGRTRPYLRWRPFRGWYEERTIDEPNMATPYREDPAPEDAATGRSSPANTPRAEVRA